MKIAVEGCCHGELDKIYETIAYLEQANNIKVDILLICGDFQSVRNRSDLQAMAVPQKYQKMNTFWKYYSGEKKAPLLTVFIGGNHEASNYLQELPYGGWVAPNIYYMGYAGILQFGGVRIGGLSGIYKGHDINKGHYEHPPYNEETKRSCYHVRNIDIFRLKQLRQHIDIFLSHDWPRGVYDFGDREGLLRRKKFLRSEVEQGILGSPPAEELLKTLKPDYWFAAHLHVKFAAVVPHQSESEEQKVTKFLSLDKCLPQRKFLQVIDIPHDSKKPLELELDPEWLAVLKNTNHLMSLSRANCYMPGLGCSERFNFSPSDQELKEIKNDFGDFFKVPDNFEQTAATHDPNHKGRNAPPQIIINSQTTLLCEMLGLTNPFAVFSGKQKHSMEVPDVSSTGDDSAYLEETIGDDSDYVETTFETSSFGNTTFETTNPDEISLDDLDASSSEGSPKRAESPEKESEIIKGENLETNLKLSVSDEVPKPSPKKRLAAVFMGVSPRPESPLTDQSPIAELFSSDDPGPVITSTPSRQTDDQEPLPVITSTPARQNADESWNIEAQSGNSVNISMESTSSSTSGGKRSSGEREDEENTPSVASQKPKKFKRRNQLIYNLSNDED